MPGAISTNLKADKVASATAGNLASLDSTGNLADSGKAAASFDAAGAASTVNTALTAHAANVANPHSVTAAQVGLGNVNNTADAAKPVSTAQQTALDAKLNKSGGTMTGALVGSSAGADFSAGDTRLGYVLDSDGNDAFSVYDRQAYDSGETLAMDWGQRGLFDANGAVSADYGVRKLVTAGGLVTVDYSGAPNGSAILSFSSANIFVAGAKIYGYSTGTNSIYPVSGWLSDSSAKISVNWSSRGLYTAAGQTYPLVDYSGANNANAAMSFAGTQANFTGAVSATSIKLSGVSVLDPVRVTWTGGGAALTITGEKAHYRIANAGTIVGATLLANASGSAVVAVRKCTYAQWLAGTPSPTSIVSSTPPTLISAAASKDTTLTGWTTAVAVDDVLEFELTTTGGVIAHLDLELMLRRGA